MRERYNFRVSQNENKIYTKRIKVHFRSELNVFSRKKGSGEGVEIKMIIKMLKNLLQKNKRKKKNYFLPLNMYMQ